MMVEPRYTSVMRSTRSGNYYNHEAVAAAWGTTTMRRLPAVAKRRDLNAALDGVAPSKDPHTFQPAFAFDLNRLVASLTKGSAAPATAPWTTWSSVSEEELTRSYAPPTSTAPENSIITYSLNKRKQKRLAAKALAAASMNGPNFEVAVANAGNEYQPQYVPRYVPEYQSDVAMAMSSRNREPSLDQQSYAL
ncbi:hypothetical protein GQ600_26421 [Phytophthora cactorum]|nr:hypothetical protein GQ600_26421 [Phytophthora cactorum]